MCVLEFTELQLDPAPLGVIFDMGFIKPTPIEIVALPPAPAGRDVFPLARAGGGKTATFVPPILQRLMHTPAGAGTRALVLTPTRELAAQVYDHLAESGRHGAVAATRRPGNESEPNAVTGRDNPLEACGLGPC